MKSAIVLFAGLVALGCRGSTEPSEDVSVAVDSAVYHLQPDHTWYTIKLTATIANNSDHDVYLSQFCPSFTLTRPSASLGQLEFGQYACAVAGGVPNPTLTLSPGATHTETFKLDGSVQPQARPQITMQELTGPAAFGFMVSNDLRKFAPVMSAPFTLAPPI